MADLPDDIALTASQRRARAAWLSGNYDTIAGLRRRYGLTDWEFRLAVPETDTGQHPLRPARSRSAPVHHGAKLTEAQVREIRASCRGARREAQAAIAKRMGVSATLVARIVRGERYPRAGGKIRRISKPLRRRVRRRQRPGRLKPSPMKQGTLTSARACRPHEAALLGLATREWVTRHGVARRLGLRPKTVRNAWWRLFDDRLLEISESSHIREGSGRTMLAGSMVSDVWIVPGYCRRCGKQTFAPRCCGSVPAEVPR